MNSSFRLPELNSVVLSGRLTRDGELSYTSGGTAKCSLRMAVNRRVKDSKTAEWRDDVFYIDVVVWRELAERSKDKVKKGVPVVVEGRLSGREYDDKSGQKRVAFEVVANRIQFMVPAPVAGEESPAAKTKGKSGAKEDSASDSFEEVPF